MTRDRLSTRYIGMTPPPGANPATYHASAPAPPSLPDAGTSGTSGTSGTAQASTVPLVLVHGFSQTGTSWAPLVSLLRKHVPTLPLAVPDAPGHGGSSSVKADLWHAAHLLAEVVDGPASWAGYSMGARMVLHVALARPEKIKRLVLISGTAGIEEPAEREARARSDEELAGKVETLGVAAFVRDWLAQPLFATLVPERAGASDRLANTPAGLASSLRLAGTGTQQPLWARLVELKRRQVPVLVIAGSSDTKYRALADRLVASVGATAQLVVIKGAGHACHLERPDEVASRIAKFLS